MYLYIHTLYNYMGILLLDTNDTTYYNTLLQYLINSIT